MIARLAWQLQARRRNPAWRLCLEAIREIHALTPAGFAAWQAQAVDDHLIWARETIPYWRERIASGAQLTDLPVLTRTALQKHAEELRDPTRPVGDLLPQASGGSTGVPVRLWQDRACEDWTLATEVHVLSGWGLEPWVPMAVVWGADRDLRELPWRERLWMRLKGVDVVNAFRMGDADLAAAVRHLERAAPLYLQGYASALDLLATYLLQHAPGHHIRPRVIRSSAEVLRPDARRRIETAFACPVRDFYGSRESAGLAAECVAGRLHVQGHGRVIELVDGEGRPVAPGQAGRVLVTDLRNRAFGLIRYECGDVATSGGADPCACGSPYPTLGRIEGRTSDFITAADGERIHGEWFTHLFYGRPGVSRFQVHQPDRSHLNVTTVGPAGAEDLHDVLDAITTRMGPGVTVRWAQAQDIEAGMSGKRRFTISDVPYEVGGAV